jgi:hypothetical protein
MGRVRRAEDLFGHELHLLVSRLLDGGDILDRQDRVALDIRIEQRDALGVADLGSVLNDVDDRHGPEQPAAGVHFLRHRQCVCQVHVAGQRVEVSTGQHDRVRRRLRADHQLG